MELTGGMPLPGNRWEDELDERDGQPGSMPLIDHVFHQPAAEQGITGVTVVSAPPAGARACPPGQPGSPQGKVLDPICQIHGFSGGGDQLQVIDAPADRHLQLVGVDDAGEGKPPSLSVGGLCQEVGIPAEQHSSEGCRPVEELGIGQATGVILFGREDIDTAEPEPQRDGARDMDIHVEADAHASRPRALRRVTRGESAASLRNRRTVCSWLAISASSRD